MKIKDLGVLPEIKEVPEPIPSVVCSQCDDTSEQDEAMGFNQALSQIKNIDIDEALKKAGWLRKMSVEEMAENIEKYLLTKPHIHINTKIRDITELAQAILKAMEEK